MTTTDTRDIVITRVLNAPVATVWNLWTDPDSVPGWWGPEDYTCPLARIDLREGGAYLFAMRAPAEQGGAVSYTGGVYTRIEPLRRLEFTQNLTDEAGVPLAEAELPDGFSQGVRTIVEFRDVGGLAELTITEKGWRRSLMSVFAYAGMHQSLDKMSERLTEASTEPSTAPSTGWHPLDLKLELVPLPVSDVDRSRSFYTDVLGFHLDHDVQPGNGMRIVQLTPPGSACSIVIGSGMGQASPDERTVHGLHLVVGDIVATRDHLRGRGADISEIDDMGGVKFAYFSDPDGNSWALQQLGDR